MKKKALYYLKISIAKCPFLSVTEKLPGTGIHCSELCNSRNVRVQTTVNGHDLSGYIRTFIRTKVYAKMTDILRAAVAVNHDVA